MTAARALSAPPPDPAGPAGLALPDAVLRPVSGNAFEVTIEQLATAIRLGVFTRGEALPPERELAERLGVSRNTLREAIAALREAGFVATRRGRGGGTWVTYAGTEPGAAGTEVADGIDVEDALDFREVVEPGAASLAASRTLAADQRAWLLQASCRAVGGAGQCRPPARGQPAASGHRRRWPGRRCSSTRSPARRPPCRAAERQSRCCARNIEHSNDQHDAIVDAILGGDPEAARRSPWVNTAKPPPRSCVA
jgi:GntR family transcriptional repressor for pyruvate dehydrogenase complex